MEIGKLYITANAYNQLDNLSITEALKRHIHGDWGNLDEEDRTANNIALETGERILSSYQDIKKVKFYIVTESDRSTTTVLLPEDY